MKPIRTEADYDAALYSIDSLMGTPQDMPEAEKLEDIVALANACEAERWQVEAPDPVSMIEHVMEARDDRQKELAALLGSQPRASEVLDRRRPLTLPMIHALSAKWKSPAELLVREYDLVDQPSLGGRG